MRIKTLLIVASLFIVTSCAGWERHKETRTKITLEKLGLEAQSGDVEAQYDLGMMYAIGYNKNLYKVPQDYQQAEKWLSMAANNNDPKAQFKLSELYFYGLGVPQDPQKGLSLLKASASAGYPVALALLGHIQRNGTDVIINNNPEEAKRQLMLQRQ